MKSEHAPVITLVLIAPFLTELLCSNIPASIFFRPHTFILLIGIYGLPALAIREMSVRWNLGLFGVLCLGMAYGIFNEGICAKTILMSKNVPIPVFDGYRFLTINVAWSILIIPWHAFHAILYPVTIVRYFFPEYEKKAWLSKRGVLIICILFSLLGILMFFTTRGYRAGPIYLPVFAVLITLIIFASKLFHGKPVPEAISKNDSFFPAIAGFVFYFTYVVGIILLAQKRLPEIVLFFYAALVLIIFYRVLKNKDWFSPHPLTCFGIGDYTALSFTAILGGFKNGSVEIIVTGILFIVLFAIVLIQGKKMIR